MNPAAFSLALKGVKQAYGAYADYRDKKAAELYDTMQEAKKAAAAQNVAAKEKVADLREKAVVDTEALRKDVKAAVADARKQVVAQVDEVSKEVSKKTAQAQKDGKKLRCKARREAKKAEKAARKNRKDLEVRAQKAIDKVTGKEAERAKNGRIATASLVFAVVAAIVGVIVWKLRATDKLPVDPAPIKQKAADVAEKAADKAAEVKEAVEEKATEAKEVVEEKATEVKEKTSEAKEATEEKVTEASQQAQIKVEKKAADKANAADAKKISAKPANKAPKPGQARK